MRFSASFTILFVIVLTAYAQISDPRPEAYLEQSNRNLVRFVLDNGMTCLVKKDDAAPLVSIQIWVGTGSIHEQDYLGGGVSHAIEHMIFKGTPTRKPGDITKTINDAGGTIRAYTSLDRTVFLVDIPASHWKTGLTVLADAVMNASFPEGEWQREKQVILREIAMNRDNPGRELSKLLWQTAFRVHPYRFPVIGYKDIFNSLTRTDLIAFFRRHYTPDNMVVVVVGDIQSSDAETALRETFSSFTRRARAPVIVPQEPQQIAPRFARQAGAYNLSRLDWTWHTVALNHPDAPALDMLATIVGNGRSSMLVREIKEKRRLAHTIDAWSYTPKEPGLFGISATFDPEKENVLIEAIESEISRWLSIPFSKEEVEKARRLLITSTLSEYQTMEGQARSFAVGEFYAGDPRFSEIYLRRLEDVTPESILEAVRKYCRKENQTLAILSPESRTETLKETQSAFIASEVQKAVLPNNISLLIKEDHKLPFVYFCVAFGGGLLFENDSNNGITRLMAELLTRGTRERSCRDIANTVESLGGSLSAFSGRNSFGLHAQCLTQDADIFMSLLSDCLLHPAFLSEEIDKQKAVQIAAIAQQHESPFFLAMEALRQALFPGRPYRFSPEGLKKTVEKISRQAILAYYTKTVVNGNVVISIFGDIDPKHARNLAEKYLKPFPVGIRPALEYEIQKPELPRVLKRTEPREQTIILAGFPGVTIRDPRLDALMVLQNAMSGLSSDLVVAIRDKQGLAYYAGAIQRPGVEPGSFVIYAGTHEQALEEVRELIMQEVTRVTTDGIRKEEFKRAKQQIIAAHQQNLQMNGKMAMECALNELYGLGYDYSFSVGERLGSLSLESVKEAAASILVPERMVTSIVLPEPSDQEPVVRGQENP